MEKPEVLFEMFNYSEEDKKDYIEWYEKKQQEIEGLLNKARNNGILSIDELEEIEDNFNICEEAVWLGIDEADECADWKIILCTGEEILVTLISEVEVS